MRAKQVLPALALLLAACSGEKASNDAGAKASAAAPATPVTSTTEAVASLPAESQGPFTSMMVSYAAIQQALAGDSTSGIVTAADAMKSAARELEAQAADPLKANYASVAAGAEALVANAGDITTARKSFGELSKSMIGLLVAKPELAKGFVVVECPMTNNYRKWLQTDEKVRNPHYGSTMLECGTIAKLEI